MTSIPRTGGPVDACIAALAGGPPDGRPGGPVVPPTRFSEGLQLATRPAQDGLLAIPFVRAAMAGELSRSAYLGFLAQAYYHVRHTVPLLMATGAALGARRRWLQDALSTYIAEEQGHDEWILADIGEAGGDPTAVREGQPQLPCELLVAYAYDMVQRRNPLGFLGMVHVLEGTSVRGASRAATALQASLGLPAAAFTYLSSHGDLDQGHVRFFADLVDRIDDPADQGTVVAAAQVFFRLYGDIFRALPTGGPTSEVLP